MEMLGSLQIGNWEPVNENKINGIQTNQNIKVKLCTHGNCNIRRKDSSIPDTRRRTQISFSKRKQHKG